MVIAKKVKPLIYCTVKKMDYTWTQEPETANNQEVGEPTAIFIPHANSLPFEERRVTLKQPIKIGRNVYRATPSANNTIFECRVLSRHHATLYYDKGHFFLVDNQSSNGTFINNNRRSISKEQEPHEVFSGDIVQFGIAVVESSGHSEQVTFPPVVAFLKLFHPDGKEAKLSFNPTMTTPLHLKELYQLNNYVQEAIQREASLESRLRTLKEALERTRNEAQASWDLFVGEQRLMMRVHTLENILAAGKQPEQNQISQLLDDKRNYQEVAQESLRAAHEHRLTLEETLERRGREAAALHQHNCALRLAANNAFAELQKLAARCERKMCAARLAIAAAEEREAAVRSHLPLTYNVQNGEAKMLVLSTDSNRLEEDGRRATAIEEAIRSLPDYVKLLLPQHLLNKVGIKAISADGKYATEFEMILKTNNIYDAESREKQENADNNALTDVVIGGEEKSVTELHTTLDTCTDDEKQSRLNNENVNDVEMNPLDGSDNNANSTYEFTNHDDSPNKGQFEYANILRVMAGLNDEIKALRDRLSVANSENEQLRSVRDELLAAKAESQFDESVELEEASAYRARISEIQTQLARSTAAEEANLAEIQRLAASTADMQAELAFRPTRADIDELTAVIGKLRSDIDEKNELLDRLRARLLNAEQNKGIVTADKAVETSVLEKDEIENNISEKIDEMFKLDYDDEEDEIPVSVISKPQLSTEENVNLSLLPKVCTLSEITNTSVINHNSQYVQLDDEERLKLTMQNGSLYALEEELVRAKERWAEECTERARLAAQVAAFQGERGFKPFSKLIFIVIPVIAAYVCFILLPNIS